MEDHFLQEGVRFLLLVLSLPLDPAGSLVFRQRLHCIRELCHMALLKKEGCYIDAGPSIFQLLDFLSDDREKLKRIIF